MWELDRKQAWAPKNWCFWAVVLEKTLESPLDYKEIQPVHSKGNQSGTLIGRTDAEAGAPILWPPDVNSWLTGKDPDAGKDWRREEKGTTGGEMVGWHHRLNGHESEQTAADSEGQGGLACYSLWRCEVRHDWATELNWTESIAQSLNWVVCCVIISSGLKEKKFYVTKTKECRRKKRCLSFPPPWEFQTPISTSRASDPFSSGTLDFLSTCLGIDSLIPSFLLGELCCQGKGVSFSFHNYFPLLRGMVPKLLRQHILLTLMLRLSDPGAPSNRRRLWRW